MRMPGSRPTLGNFMRAQLSGMFGTLSLGMQVLADEGVALDAMVAHGGVFRTAGVAQRLLAAALGAPVSVGVTAGEGGAWGMAVLAAFRGAYDEPDRPDLAGYLATRVFASAETTAMQMPAIIAQYWPRSRQTPTSTATAPISMWTQPHAATSTSNR